MDKFSKILVSAAAASVLASGAMASGLVFGKYANTKSSYGYLGDTTTASDRNVTLAIPNKSTRTTIKDATADSFGAIKVDELLKSQNDLEINATDATSWKGTFVTTRYNRMLAYYSDSALPKGTTLRFKINCE